MDLAEVQRTNWEFTVGDNAASMVGDLFWFGPLKPLLAIRLGLADELKNLF